MRLNRPISVILTTAALAFGLISQAANAQQYKKVMRLGTSQAVCPGGVETPEQLQEFFANNPSAVRQILADSGWSGSADALIAAIANGEMSERAYPVGTKMAWMGAKKNGAYVANPYREWAGAKSFEAFQVNVSSDCQVYHLAIPKACCNVSLISVQADTSSQCTEPVAAAPVAAAPVAVTPEEPKAKASPLGLIPFLGVFAGTETRPRFETRWEMEMRDSSGIAGIRAGLMKPLSEKTALFSQVSYYDRQGVNGGNEYPENNFAVDVGIERKLSKSAFIGGGIGAWNIDDSDFRDASLFGHVGGDIGKSNFQWILEGRVFDSDSEELDSISDNKMFSAGIRYLIK